MSSKVHDDGACALPSVAREALLAPSFGPAPSPYASHTAGVELTEALPSPTGLSENAPGAADKRLCRRNVRAMLAFQILSNLAWGMAMGPVFDRYLYRLGGGFGKGPSLVPLSHGRNSLVGFAESISGLSSLVLALPVGLLVDRFPTKRALILRASCVLGLLATVLTVLSILTDELLIVYAMLLFFGAFNELSSSASEAIFTDSVPQGERSGIFTTKAILSTIGYASGPAISAVGLACLGDEWKPYQMKAVIAAGALCMPPALLTLFFFQDPPNAGSPESHGREESSQNLAVQAGDDGSISTCDSDSRELTHPPERHFLCFRPWHVPFMIASSNFVTAIGAGMTVKFFNLFFIQDEKFLPVQISLLQTAYPLIIAVFMKVTQRAAKPLGRSQASLAFFSCNVLCLLVLGEVSNLPLLIAVYLLRGGFANSSSPLDRSIMMDFTPSSQRGRWNAVESFTGMTWSGSAFIGGILSDSRDYRYTFRITATVYAVACLVYSPLLGLVPRREGDVAKQSGQEAAS